MLFSSKEEVSELNTEQAQERLKQILQTWDIETPIGLIPKETWDLADDICNNILWLEDRIHAIEVSNNIKEAMKKHAGI